MTYRAYIDNIRAKTGKTPEDYRRMAKEKGLAKYGELLRWLKTDCGLGHGHANAIILYIQSPELAKRKMAEEDAKNKKKKTKGAGSSRARKKIVRSFFNLVVQGRQQEGLRFFAPNCRQHNPYVQGGMDALFGAMTAMQKEAPKYPDPHFAVRSVLADGDMVAVHTELLSSGSTPGEGGLRQVHLFRFGRGNKIVEYWDVTQQVQPGMPNAANAF